MAEQLSSSPLAPATPATGVVEGEYMMSVKEFEPGGTKSLVVSVKAPSTADFNQWTLMQQVVMLKKGGWSKSPINEVMFGVAYAKSLGLDVMRGDVFPTGEGRLGIANKAKIKLAQLTGNIVGIETTFRELTDAPFDKCPGRKFDLECTAVIHVKGWTKPITRVQRLSSWFVAKNPNWVGRPEHMLELNTVAHACEYVPGAALATEDDERPPVAEAAALDTASAPEVALNQAIAAASTPQLSAAPTAEPNKEK